MNTSNIHSDHKANYTNRPARVQYETAPAYGKYIVLGMAILAVVLWWLAFQVM